MLLTVATLATGAITAPTASAVVDPGAVTVPDRYLNQRVKWQPCDFDLFLRFEFPDAPATNCASVVVPMDWRHPDQHPDIEIAIAYSKATGTTKGLFTMNPGGPGVPALEDTAFFGAENAAFWTDYDLLGLDPRGFGDSERIHCYSTLDKIDSLTGVDDPRTRSKAAHTAELASAKVYGEACSSTEFSQFVNTQQTVYDLEFLRRYLGHDKPAYDKLSYLGYSYGSWLGAWYADTYPSHTGRFILDSNMNWTASMYANQLTDSFSFERRRDQMLYPWIARRNSTYELGSTAAKVKRRYEKIRSDLLALYRSGGFVMTVTDADYELLGNVYSNRQFPLAASALLDIQAIVSGSNDPAQLAKAQAIIKRNQRAGSGSLDARSLRADAAKAEGEETFEVGGGELAVRCNDSQYPRDLTGVLLRSDRDAVKYPFIGYTNTVSMCSFWKFAPTTRTVDLVGAPRMLMFQSEGDPATAYEGALAAHRATADYTRLVSVDDEGQHGLYLNGASSCVNQIGNAFLFNGVLPAKDTVCGTSPLPRDKKVYKLDGPLDGHSYSLASTHSTERVAQPNPTLAKLLDDAARRSRG